MLQGTGSGVGKSVLTAALCRLFARAGYRVAPFKSQNMSLNAAVTADGLEIGRAQAAQAEAAGLEPSVDMNPILLKPEADDRSQVVVRGVAVGTATFREYAALRPALRPVVEESLARLRSAYDLVLIEGAGSPAEINLRDGELVNMSVARMADAPVVLVGDIDRGGVFAALFGTVELLTPEERARIGGFVVNKLRGDAALLRQGLDELTARTGIPVLGVVPHLAEVGVAAEDSLDLEARAPAPGGTDIDIAVVRLPRIANFDDFEPLAREPGVAVRFVRGPAELGAADLIVLPGSKSTVADLGWLRATGLAEAIVRAAADGRQLFGICGGFQMLGEAIRDPSAVESSVPTTPGLGLLPAITTFAAPKTTRRVRARVLPRAGLLADAAGTEVRGYEIHAGLTEVRTGPRLFAVLARGAAAVTDADGAVDPRGNVAGTYLHGLFASGAVRRALLGRLAGLRGVAPDPVWGTASDAAAGYDRLADAVAASVDVAALAKLVGVEFPRP
jgi:adenosylcobyric acid synthase